MKRDGIAVPVSRGNILRDVKHWHLDRNSDVLIQNVAPVNAGGVDGGPDAVIGLPVTPVPEQTKTLSRKKGLRWKSKNGSMRAQNSQQDCIATVLPGSTSQCGCSAKPRRVDERIRCAKRDLLQVN